MIQLATLQTLKVKELDKYLTRHNLPTVGRKDDKVKRITADYYIHNNVNEATPVVRNDEFDSDSEHESDSDFEHSGSDGDEVIQILPEDEDYSTDEEQLSDTKIILLITRSSRRATRFSSKYKDFCLC